MATLLEKRSKFPQCNMKCRGKRDTTWTIPHSIRFSPLHFMLYRGKSITFGTVWHPDAGSVKVKELLSVHTCLAAYKGLAKPLIGNMFDLPGTVFFYFWFYQVSDLWRFAKCSVIFLNRVYLLFIMLKHEIVVFKQLTIRCLLSTLSAVQFLFFYMRSLTQG